MSGVALAVGLAMLVGCNGRSSRSNWDPAPPVPPGLGKVTPKRAASEAPHPRLVFTKERIALLRHNAEHKTELWQRLERRCELFRETEQSSGYLGLRWAEAVGELTTCWYATGDVAYRDRAMHYLRGLVNDRHKIGDNLGGNDVIHGNSGYPIRAYGVYTALAYDWLHDAPGMEALRPAILERLGAWIDWYGEEGYLNDSPYSNYFWGYFTTLAIAGLATDGESKEAEKWIAETKELLDELVIPGFQQRLKGGEWAEGWQYGQLVAMEVALVVDGFYTATGADYAKGFSWLGEIVSAHLHRTHPSGASWYGNGTQHVRPPPPDGSALASALLVLDRTDPKRAAQARFMLRHMFPPLGKTRLWFAALSDRPGAKEVDPRDAEVLSYHLPGHGQSFLRSSWQPDAVWVSLQAGPRVAIDHEHNDQGHFEIWRGQDALLGDFATESGYATINHNSLLIDDADDVLNYTPNHGVWGRKSRTTGFYDQGRSVVVVGDITDAWAPKCVERGCDERAVDKVERTLVFVRPDVVITRDSVDLDEDEYGVTWIAHSRGEPAIAGQRAAITSGNSRLDVVALAPGNAKVQKVAEPTPSPDHIYKANRPDGRVWRIEIDTPRGDDEREIITWMRAQAAGGSPAKVARVRGERLDGGVGEAGGEQIAVLFARSEKGGQAALPPGTVRVVIAGLAKDGIYRTTLAPSPGGDCKVAVTPSEGGAAKADPAGALSIELGACARVGAGDRARVETVADAK